MSVDQTLKGKRFIVPFHDGRGNVREQEYEIINLNSKSAVLRKRGPRTRGCEYDTWPVALVRDWVRKNEASDANK